MSDLSTKRMLAAYRESAGAPMFGASMFTTRPQDIHSQEKVVVDVRRDGRPIAIPVVDHTSGGRVNVLGKFTSKEWAPPVLYEEFRLNTFDSSARQMGQDPFEDVNFLSGAQRQLTDGVDRMIDKIRRTLELQAWQIFQDGALDLQDDNGISLYELDYQMKADHKFDAAVPWDSTSPEPDPLLDMESGDELVRVNGKANVDRWVYGENAWRYFLNNQKVQNLLDNRRIQLGGISPRPQTGGEVFQGTMIVNGMVAELYTYRASYDHPQTGADTPYVSPWNVVGIASNGVRRATFGRIPRVVDPDPRVAGLGIGDTLAADQGMAFTTNAWVDDRGTVVSGSVATRALLVPVAIDTHVCINTNP